MPKKSENYLKAIGSLALVLNVCLQDEKHFSELDSDKLFMLHTLSKAYECFKGVFTKDQRSVVSHRPGLARSTWYSSILSGYTKDASDKTLCRNMMRIAGSRNLFVGHTFEYYGDFSQNSEEIVNFTSILIELKKYLEMQKQRINLMLNRESLKSLPTPNYFDKSVQCSKSTEFLKDSSSDHSRFVSPSRRAITAEQKKQTLNRPRNYETCRKYSCDRLFQPRLSSSRLSLRRRRAESCPECRETKILASVKRRIDEDLGANRVYSRTCCSSCGNSSYVIPSCESLNSFYCPQCEEIRRMHHLRHCCRCNCWTSPAKTTTGSKIQRYREVHRSGCQGTKPCYSIDSGIDLPPQRSDDECSTHQDKEVQTQLVPIPSNETISSGMVDGAVRKFTEDLILCERRAKENFYRKQRSLSPMSDCSSSNSTWNHLKNLNNLSEDDLISSISTPSLVSLSDQEDAT